MLGLGLFLIQTICTTAVVLLSFMIAYMIINGNLKGIYRAWRVRMILKELNKDQYKVYHDVSVPLGKNAAIRVDHLVTSRHGIIVIKTRNSIGWDTGYTKALENSLNLNEQFFTTLFAVPDKSNDKFKGNFAFASTIHFSELLQTISAYDWKIIGEERLQKVNRKLDILMSTNNDRKREISEEKIIPISPRIQQSKISSYDKLKSPEYRADLIEKKRKL